MLEFSVINVLVKVDQQILNLAPLLLLRRQFLTEVAQGGHFEDTLPQVQCGEPWHLAHDISQEGRISGEIGLLDRQTAHAAKQIKERAPLRCGDRLGPGAGEKFYLKCLD